MTKVAHPNRLKSFAFVLVQFACIGLLIVTGPMIVSGVFYLVLEAGGVLLGLWAIWAMRMGNFNITPDVRANGQLAMRGPYRFVRHPMYSSVLFTTLVIVLNEFSPLRFAVWVVLLIDLSMKLAYEEKLLAQHFEDYAAYAQRTKRLVPFVY